MVAIIKMNPTTAAAVPLPLTREAKEIAAKEDPVVALRTE